jgi:hypothetical protein
MVQVYLNLPPSQGQPRNPNQNTPNEGLETGFAPGVHPMPQQLELCFGEMIVKERGSEKACE